jgi:hypothetical protein
MPSNPDPLGAKREAAYQRLGIRTPHCTQCAEADPLALTGAEPDILCYECRALAAGRSPIEQNHPAGQHNDPNTTPIPGNDHRVFSAYQSSWPRDTLRNPEGSPLLRAAAALRGWLDTLRLILERTVGWVPAFLETLDGWLGQQLGPRWWDGFEWEGGAPC